MLAPFLIIFMAALVLPQHSEGAEKRTRKQAAKAVSSAPVQTAINDVNLHESLATAEDRLKKGRTDEALKMLQAVHGYVDDNVRLMTCVGEAYDKARNDPALKQDQKESLYLKRQRMGTLLASYTRVRGESAYDLGLAYSKKGDLTQARKYLIEACQTAPFSLDPASLWMRSKNLFLTTSKLDGEF